MEIRIANESCSVSFKLPTSLQRSNSQDWNTVGVIVSAGAWTGREIQMKLKTSKLEEFLADFSGMLKDLSGEVTLESNQGWLELKLKFEKNGAILVSGSAKDSENGNRLDFKFESDQSYFSGSPKKIDSYLEQN